MKNITEQYAVTSHAVRIAVDEHVPESNYGTVPVVDQHDAIEAYRAYDDGGLAEAASAFGAYLKSLQASSY